MFRKLGSKGLICFDFVSIFSVNGLILSSQQSSFLSSDLLIIPPSDKKIQASSRLCASLVDKLIQYQALWDSYVQVSPKFDLAKSFLSELLIFLLPNFSRILTSASVVSAAVITGLW